MNQRRAPKKLSKVSSVENEKYQTIGQTIGQATCQKALGKACTKHAGHQTPFRVEVKQESMHGVYGSRFKFIMAFTHLNLADFAHQDDL